MLVTQNDNTYPETSVRITTKIPSYLLKGVKSLFKKIGKMVHPDSACLQGLAGLQSYQTQEVPCPVTP